jgi:hypothetical protein
VPVPAIRAHIAPPKRKRNDRPRAPGFEPPIITVKKREDWTQNRDAVRAGQLPAACTTGRAVAGGPSSARSISSKVRPLGSGPNTQKPIRPTTLHEAK